MTRQRGGLQLIVSQLGICISLGIIYCDTNIGTDIEQRASDRCHAVDVNDVGRAGGSHTACPPGKRIETNQRAIPLPYPKPVTVVFSDCHCADIDLFTVNYNLHRLKAIGRCIISVKPAVHIGAGSPYVAPLVDIHGVD